MAQTVVARLLYRVVHHGPCIPRAFAPRVAARLGLRLSSAAAAWPAAYGRAVAALDAGDASIDGRSPEDVIADAAAAGVPAARGRVGHWLLLGLAGRPRDVRSAVVHLHTAAVAGDVHAAYWLGRAWGSMDEVQRDAAREARGAAAALDSEARDNDADDSPEAAADGDSGARAAAARVVLDEVRAARKAARAERRRAEAAAAARSSPSATAPGLATGADDFTDDDPAKQPLVRDARRAAFWLLRAAAAHHAGAQTALGNLYMASEPRDVPLALDFYALAAGVAHHAEPPGWAGRPHATAADAGAASPGDGGAASGEASSPRAAADGAAPSPDGADDAVAGEPTPAGHPDALFNLGMVYHDGVEGSVPVDRLRAAAYFRSAADAGDADAALWLGHAMRVGDAEAGVARNGRAALRLLERAAGGGHGGAAHYLSRLYRDGDPAIGVRPHPQRVAFFLRAAADAGHPDALFELGHAHCNGIDGAPQDDATALELFERAGLGGHADALVSAGAMRYHGRGAPRSSVAAFRRYSAAAALGHAGAWENVAAMHATGDGVPVNLDAARWIRRRVLPALAPASPLDVAANEASGSRAGFDAAASSAAPAGEAVTASESGGGCGSAACACKAGKAQAQSTPLQMSR